MESLKMKNCSTCGRKFLPFRTFDKTCSYQCAVNLQKKKYPEPKKQPRVKQMSIKRKAQTREYATVRADYLAYHPFCGVCQQGATEIHHINGRTNERLLDTKYFLPVCRPCHRWIHANPEASREYGFLL
jgi:hypothetical protein